MKLPLFSRHLRSCSGPLAALVLLLTASNAPAQKIGEVERVQPSTSAPAGEVLEWTSEEGQEYWYRLPKKAKGKPALIFMLHGTGLNHGWSFWNYPIARGAFRSNDIVVSPDGLTPGNGDTFNFVQNRKDGDQIVGLIELFRSKFDVGHVYLYGHSQGAFFCYWFAGEHPELVDGIVAHAGNVLNVKHSKLAKDKVAIGILHAASDQVVPVKCATRTEKIYQDQGYKKLKCWIVEGIRDQAGHWPLPQHVATMFEWLDEVTTSNPVQAVEVARSALAKKIPDFAVAVRAARDARLGFKKYKGDDKDEALATLEHIDGALAVCASATIEVLLPAFVAAAKGKEPGPWAADARWCRRSFAGVEAFEKGAKPLKSLFKSHDKLLAGLQRIKDQDSKKYAKAALKAVQNGYLADEWDALSVELARRIEAGWAPVEDLASGVEAAIAAASALGKGTRTEALKAAVQSALDEYSEAHPSLLTSD